MSRSFKHFPNYFYLFILLFLSSFAYSQVSEGESWVSEFNKSKLYVSILDEYHQNAGIDYGDGFYNSRNDIYSSLINLKDEAGQIKAYKLLHQHVTNNGHKLEITSFQGAKNDISYVTITGYRNTNGTLSREFDFIRKGDKVEKSELNKIDVARNNWVQFSNQHDPKKLLDQVYTKNSLYYNNGQLSRGREAITERYGYMNHPSWTISLTPVKTILVNNKRAFEIGTYLSSGKGDYVLIWERGNDGKWRVLLDFNF